MHSEDKHNRNEIHKNYARTLYIERDGSEYRKKEQQKR